MENNYKYKNESKFWLNDPLVLIKSFSILPKGDMTREEKFNAITRLLILTSIVLYILDYQEWYIVLLIGLIIIIVIEKSKKIENFGSTNTFTVPNGRPPKYEPCGECNGIDTQTDQINRMYELTPGIQFNHDNAAKRSYMNAKYELTPLRDEPGFKDIWRNDIGDNCGGYSMIPDPVTIFPEDGEDGIANDRNESQCNYIFRSKADFLPITQSGSNGLIAVRPEVEQAFVDNTILFRNTIQGEHVDRFVRERKHNCNSGEVKLMRTTAGS